MPGVAAEWRRANRSRICPEKPGETGHDQQIRVSKRDGTDGQSALAHVCAIAGFDVRLRRTSIRAAIERAVQLVDRNLVSQVSRGQITEEGEARAMRPTILDGTAYAIVRDLRRVIERRPRME